MEENAAKEKAEAEEAEKIAEKERLEAEAAAAEVERLANEKADENEE